MASKPASKKPTEPQKKSERTRALIVETALELFRAQGYEQTTMRKIAEAAGVSAGNAYYYFASKEELVQAFYDELQERHGKELKRVLPAESALADRLRVSLLAFQKVARPYHAFADKFFKVAASPHSARSSVRGPWPSPSSASASPAAAAPSPSSASSSSPVSSRSAAGCRCGCSRPGRRRRRRRRGCRSGWPR